MLEKSDFEVLRGIIKDEVQTSVKVAVKEEVQVAVKAAVKEEVQVAVKAAVKEEVQVAVKAAVKEEIHTLRDEMKETEKNLRREFNTRLDETERLMLDEIGRTHKNLLQEIQKVDARVDRLEEYYRITHLEGDTAQILLERTDHLEKRLRVCERRLGIA